MNDKDIDSLQLKLAARLKDNANLALSDAVLLNQSEAVIKWLKDSLAVCQQDGACDRHTANDANKQRSTMIQASKILMQMKENEERVASRSGDHVKALVAQSQAAILKHLLVSVGEKS